MSPLNLIKPLRPSLVAFPDDTAVGREILMAMAVLVVRVVLAAILFLTRYHHHHILQHIVFDSSTRKYVGTGPSLTPAPSSVAGSRQSTPGPQNPKRLRSVSVAPSDVSMESNSQPIDEEEDEDDRISSGSATPAKRSRQTSPARDQRDQQASFALPSNSERFVEKMAAFQSSLERGQQALQELLDAPNRDAYISALPDAGSFARSVFELVAKAREIPQFAAWDPAGATTGDWSSFTNYFASGQGGSGTLFSEGQRPSTPPP
ncbi:hypothetical protein CPC08DRAFT_769852, partial [Agrocybe pediades]